MNLRRELEEASAAVTAAEVEIARIDADVADATRRLDSAGDVEPAEGDDRDELATRVDRLETRRATLGQVNPLAREEYEAEKERLDDLKMQRTDLEQSLEELEKLRAELTATVERRFAETFSAVAEHFEEVASTLFPGGEGRLRLVEAEEEGGEPGVEVELRPAGQADHAALAALGRREGARRDLVPLRALPREAVRVLPPGRGRGGARRHEHRALRRAPAPLLRSRAVRRRHAPEEDDGGRRYPLRRDDGAGRRLAGRFAAPSAAPAAPRRHGVSYTWSELLGDDVAPEDESERTGFFARMRDSLAKSRVALTAELASAGFDSSDDEAWERLEEALIRSDVGVPATAELVRRLEARGVTGDLEDALVTEVEELFGDPPTLALAARPSVILVVGRQRHREDDDDRQARAQAPRARAVGARRRGGHLSRGRRGAARDLGGARGRGLRRRATRRGSGRRRIRRGRGGAGTRDATSRSSTPPGGSIRSRTSWPSSRRCDA